MKFILFFFLFANILFAQTSLFVVDSASGTPVLGAVVDNGISRSVTGENGICDISSFDPARVITITHVAYHNYTLKISSNDKSIIVKLVASPSEKDEVVISGEGDKSGGFSKKIENINEDGEGYRTLADIISRNFGLFVKDYGGSGSLKQISFRGMSPENSLVLFNGVRVNDIRTGGFDLSGIFPGELRTAEFSTSAAADGEISAGGVLKIDTRGRNDYSFISTEKMDDAGMVSISGSGNYSSGNFYGGIAAERMWSPNRFDYEFDGAKLQRENAHFNRSFASLSLGYISKDFVVDFYANYGFYKAGVPGFVVSNNASSSGATNTTEGTLNILRFATSFNEKSGIESSIGYSNQLLNFDDPNRAYYKENGADISTLNNISFNLRGYLKGDNATISGGYGLETGTLSDIKTILSNYRKDSFVKRRVHRVLAKVDWEPRILPALFSNIFITGGINGEFFFQEGIGERDENGTSWNGGIAFVPAGFEHLLLKANWFGTTRIPTYNEYYYSALVSTNSLNPEKTKGFEAGIEIKGIFPFVKSFSAVWFTLETWDKIIWVPSIITLQIPRNISKVSSEGVDLSLSLSFFNNALEADFAFSYLSAQNISSYGSGDKSDRKQLVYTPKERFINSVSWASDHFKVILDHRFVGKSFFTTDNDPYFLIQSHSVFDLHLTTFFNLFSARQSFGISIYNLFNENYKLIQSYPMPLRSVIFSLTTKI